MNYRKLGKTSFEISEIALGTWQVGGKWGSPANTPERPVTDKSFDYGLYLTFDSLEDHDTYQVDPLHDVFVDTCKDLWSQVKVMDVT